MGTKRLRPGPQAQIIERRYQATGSTSGDAEHTSRKRRAETSPEQLRSEHHPDLSRPSTEIRWSRALDYPEHNLSHQEASRLKAQRVAQQHELSSFSDAGFPERCFSMANDNVLAQRNHVGRALIFLQSSNDPETNIHWLTRYLVKLGAHQSPPPSPRINHRVMECAELGARYIVQHSDWFKGKPIQLYATMANRLSKHPENPVCMRALARIAGEVLSVRDLRSPNVKSQALLVGAFAKNKDSERCRDAVLSIVGHALQDRRCVFGSQDIHMFLNALSKWSDNRQAEEAACLLAEKIADPHLRLKQKMDATQVANILHAFSKWPQQRVIKDQAVELGGIIVTEPRLRQKLGHKEMGSALHALSQWTGEHWAWKATHSLAKEMRVNRALFNQIGAESLTSCLNALSKWSDKPEMGEFISILAKIVVNDDKMRWSMGAQQVGNTLNALSKWPTEAHVKKAALALADRLTQDGALREQMNAQGVSNVLNALSKWPSATPAAEASLALGDRLAEDEALRAQMSAQGVSNVLNALSKWPEDKHAREAGLSLAVRLTEEGRLRGEMNEQELSITLNALCKWPGDSRTDEVLRALAGRLAGDEALRAQMNAQGISNALNALSKWPEDTQASEAVLSLAEKLTQDGKLRREMNAQNISNALNALSKWPDAEKTKMAALSLTERLAQDGKLRDELNAQNTSNVVNALSKWSGEEQVQNVILPLAERLIKDDKLRNGMTTQNMSITLNALSKWPKLTPVREAADLLIAPLGSNLRPWRDVGIANIAQIANALNALSKDETREIAMLERFSFHLELHPERLKEANLSDISVLFKAYNRLHMQRALRPMALPALARTEALLKSDALRDASLESVATICLGLLPLARSGELQRYRSKTLKTLEALLPVVARKIDAYLRHANSASLSNVLHLRDNNGEACGTRRPALSFYQVLKTYHLVARQWKPTYIEGDRDAIKERQNELKTWVQETLARTQDAISADLQDMSWNLIAQIEAGDNLYDALDMHIDRDAAAIAARHPPITFDLADIREQLRTPPGRPVVPPAGMGATWHIIVDINGQEVKKADGDSDGPPPYSFYTRLTNQPLVEVQLPGELSSFMLSRTFTYQNEPWRFDLFGGSRLQKARRNTVSDILEHRETAKSQLPAIRYADTMPGSDFMRLVEKLSPQREDWSRMQRALLEMVPADHVIEGTLRLGWCADVPGPQHPFKLTSPSGERLALCPNDGCGFLKWEVAQRIPVVKAHMEAWAASQTGQVNEAQRTLLKSQEVHPNSVPPQAMMHYPRSDAVRAEAYEALQNKLAGMLGKKKAQQPTTSQSQPHNQMIGLQTLYHMLVSSGYEGRRVRAVPSADDRLYLPTINMPGFQRPTCDVLLGKPPYDKENLQAISADKVITPVDGNATARFLDQCFSIQYSYTGFNDDADEDTEMLHSKGMLIIPPPGYWSPDHAEQDMVCSREDLKILSRWKMRRDRGSLPDQMLSTGNLRVKDTLIPGRLGALPIPEMRKRNMDTDGDEAYVYMGYPALTTHIREVMAERTQRRGAEKSFKPEKTATAAIDDQGRYHFGRSREIMNEQIGSKLLGRASTLANRFLAQPDDLREKMAHTMMFGVYDGIERSLRNGLRQWLAGENDAQALKSLRAQALSATDRAHLPEAREAAKLLHYLTLQLGGPGDKSPPEISSELAIAMPRLAIAYAQATDTPSRINAILDNYPVCRISHEQFPNGQPGLVSGEPELTIRNLFTLAVKIGTDALKSDTGVRLFTKVIDSCEMTERGFHDRIRDVPYSKKTARELRDGHFDPEQAKKTLASIPTLAASVMEVGVEMLQQEGLVKAAPTLQDQAQSLSLKALRETSLSLHNQARQAEPGMTLMLQRLLPAGAYLAGLDHCVKSVSSLEDKVKRLYAEHQQNLSQAASLVNDMLRYSIVLPDTSFADGYRKVLATLEGEGHELLKCKNYFARWNSPFKAINVHLRGPDNGLNWEIQFHTAESFPLKERYHDLYKQQSRLSFQGTSSSVVRSQLNEAVRACRNVTIPAGCEDINDWRAQ
ncbi:XopAD/skwp family type III secretion system effector [Brenneria rubrifaciens]|nr:XopAD/skwp family type III secretion system effector [Brenneria rubrifaciens]